MSVRDIVRGWLGIKNEDSPITTSREFAEFLLRGGLNKSISGEAVTPNSAMTVASVYAAVNLLAQSIGSLPIHLMRRVETEFGPGEEKAKGHNLYPILLKKPNKWQTATEFKEMMMMQLLLRGNAYALITRRGSLVLELIPIEADRVQVKQLENLDLEYTVTKKNGSGQLKFSSKSMFHIRALTVDGVTGVTPLKWWRETIGGSLATQRHGSSLFGNGAFPSGVLEHPKRLSKEAGENLKLDFEENVKGDNLNSLMILEEGITWKQTTMTNEDAQFLETRNFQRSEIAAIFRVPPHMIGDLSRATFSNIEQQERSFASNSLAPWAGRWEGAIWRDLIPRSDQEDFFAKLNLNAWMRGDTKTRGDFYVKMKSNGLMSANEIRALEGLNPREGGDEFTEQLNMGSNEDENPESQTEQDDEGAGGTSDATQE